MAVAGQVLPRWPAERVPEHVPGPTVRNCTERALEGPFLGASRGGHPPFSAENGRKARLVFAFFGKESRPHGGLASPARCPPRVLPGAGQNPFFVRKCLCVVFCLLEPENKAVRSKARTFQWALEGPGSVHRRAAPAPSALLLSYWWARRLPGFPGPGGPVKRLLTGAPAPLGQCPDQSDRIDLATSAWFWASWRPKTRRPCPLLRGRSVPRRDRLVPDSSSRHLARSVPDRPYVALRPWAPAYPYGFVSHCEGRDYGLERFWALGPKSGAAVARSPVIRPVFARPPSRAHQVPGPFEGPGPLTASLSRDP